MGAPLNLGTTYTEADPNARIGVVTVTATYTGIKRDENAYLYKDWGAGFFGDFVHDFETTGTTWANGSKLVVWGISDTVAAMSGWTAGLYLLLNATSTTAGTYTLGEVGGAAGTTVGASIAKTIMFWRIERNGTTLTAKRATSAANRAAGVFAETLTLTVANTAYQYQFAGSSFNDANTTAVTQTTANFRGTGMNSSGTPFDSAYMAGASAGNWNAGATWGNAGSSKGTDFPGTAVDVFSIDPGDTVTYNVSETNALGDSTVYGVLTFKKDSSTKMVFGSNTLSINGTGELRIGNDANPIDPSYVAELYFTPTADGTKGVLAAATATINVVGSDVNNSKQFSYLIADWSAGQTFTVKGDVRALWAAGQKVVVHRFRATFQAQGDGGEYTIASMAANGSDTDITISEAAPGVTFRAGAIAAHSTRNVIYGKAGATLTLASSNTNRAAFIHAGTSLTASVINVKNVVFVGIYGFQITGRYDLTNVVIRNSAYAGGWTSFINYYGIWSQVTCISCGNFINYTGCSFTNLLLGYFSGGIGTILGCRFKDVYVFNFPSATATMLAAQRNNRFHDCDFVDCNYYLASPFNGNDYFNCNFGKFRHHANDCTRNNDLYTTGSNEAARFYNCWFKSDPPSINAAFWASVQGVNVSFDDFNNTLGDTRRYTNWYATKSNATTVRGGGSAVALEVFRLDNCTARARNEPILEWVEWGVAASAQTRKIYIRGGTGGAEDWSTYPTAAELYLEAEYYDEAGTTHKAFAVSTDVLTDNTTWTAFNLSFTPGRVGQVVYRLRLGLVTGVASVKLYVDPQLNS